jgi:hypothetical protein
MTKAKLQETLQSFTFPAEPISVEMYLLIEDEAKNITTYLPAVEDDQLSVILSKIVRSQIINTFFNDNEDYTYKVVSVNSAEADTIRQVYHISKDEIPKTSIIFDSVIKNTAEDFSKDQALENIWAYIFKANSGNTTLYLFKRNYPINVLKKDKNYALFFDNNKLSLIDKDIIRLSSHFDVMLVNKELIILNRTEFEKAFDYIGAMQATATANVEIIKKSKLIENKSTLRKLLNINPHSKILTKRPKQIMNLAKKYKVEFTMTTDESRLSIITKKAATAFILLLNDDYLKSEFSESLYKIKGKSPISSKVK